MSERLTAFKRVNRLSEPTQQPGQRTRHFREFVDLLPLEGARTQASRCMDCGVPFCANGCPVHNLIPDFNSLVYEDRIRDALERLHETNNFPEFTGRVCPAPCEAACTLGVNREPVGIKSIERFIVDYGWSKGWIEAQPPRATTGKRVSIVGSGPAGLACAQQLARLGHQVTVFEKADRIGGLLRYGIPDFKLEKSVLDRRLKQLAAEGICFKPSTEVNQALATELLRSEDAIVLAVGSETPRDLSIPGRDLNGIHFAMDYLALANREATGDGASSKSAKGKRVLVIGGGDTGSDCVGTAWRQGAASVSQLEITPCPPSHVDPLLVWPYWPLKLRTSSSQEEGAKREWSVLSHEFFGEAGDVRGLQASRCEFVDGVPTVVPDTEVAFEADLILLAMGFLRPSSQIFQHFGIMALREGHAETPQGSYQTMNPKVYAAGDARRGQSLVVWAIREGRDCAAEIHLRLAE